MGVDSRRPPLPAPTESSTLQISREDVTGTDFATDLSRRTDHTSYSIPEDGSPVTITTSKRKDHKQKERENTLTRTSQQSQTSLLIEYFEGGKGPNVHTRPSVRVKVTPSSGRKSKDSKDHIQITEAGGHRKPSYTRRISLGPKGAEVRAVESDERSISSYTSAAEDSNLARRPPVEIEVVHRGQGSDISGTNMLGENEYLPINPSEISSMPPDSMLEGNTASSPPRRKGSRSLARDEVNTATDTLKAPSRGRTRSLSRERLAQKVIEKLNTPRKISGEKSRHGKSRSRSVSKEQLVESLQSPKRKSTKYHTVEDIPSGADSSLLTMSQVSNKRKSGDQYSFRSGTSKSSINNPKLLETVEDAIRRLILPELTALKHEQNRSKFERDRRESFVSGSSRSREELTRKGSKHASAPDLKGPKVVLNRDEHSAGTILSGNSIKGRKEHRYDRKSESPSERSFDRGMSEETVIRDGGASRKRSKDGHRLRDTAAGGLMGALTYAALKHHDSKSSVDHRERRKRRGKSHSRSASVAESTEEIFHKHDVPPMPMRSEITESDLTRESLLSERTSTPTLERRRAEIRYVARGSPREVISPGAITPTRSPGASRGLGTYHNITSHGEAVVQDIDKETNLRDSHYHHTTGGAALAGATAAAGAFAAAHVLDQHGGNVEHTYAHGRGLSPIQSVASFRDESEPPNRDSMRRTHSSESFSSAENHEKRDTAMSIKTLSSVPSTEYTRSKRHKGISLESEREILEPHNQGDFESQNDDAWYEQQHAENDHYRDSLGNDSFRDSTVDIRHLTNYTDDSMDAPYLDKVTAAQHIRGIGANPEYVHTPLAVESAVASLHDPSVLDVPSTRSGLSKNEERSYLDSPNDDDQEYIEAGRRELYNARHGSPLKDEYHGQENDFEVHNEGSHNKSVAMSPPHDTARSLEEHDEPIMTATGIPDANDPIPEIGHGLESKSDISTNPSIIQGPLGGVAHDNRTHWPFQPTPPQSKGDLLLRSNNTSAHESLKAVAANMLSAAAAAGGVAALTQRDRKLKEERDRDLGRDLRGDTLVPGGPYPQEADHDFASHDQYTSGQPIPTPLLAKDEGYISAANPRSTGALTPDYRNRKKGLQLFDDEDPEGTMNDMNVDEDPFVSQSHMRHLSGNSHGMSSPLYDSATGRGKDRIQSKDVVALMDHVRG